MTLIVLHGADKMADPKTQLKVEAWVRETWMPEMYGQGFTCVQVSLCSGGCFEFDAVSEDHKTVATISTSRCKTEGGNVGTGKMHKIRSDVYFLLLARAERKMAIFTERDMYDKWCKEKKKGRVPDSIEFFHVQIPEDLNSDLRNSRQAASREVTPK